MTDSFNQDNTVYVVVDRSPHVTFVDSVYWGGDEEAAKQRVDAIKATGRWAFYEEKWVKK